MGRCAECAEVPGQKSIWKTVGEGKRETGQNTRQPGHHGTYARLHTHTPAELSWGEQRQQPCGVPWHSGAWFDIPSLISARQARPSATHARPARQQQREWKKTFVEPMQLNSVHRISDRYITILHGLPAVWPRFGLIFRSHNTVQPLETLCDWGLMS